MRARARAERYLQLLALSMKRSLTRHGGQVPSGALTSPLLEAPENVNECAVVASTVHRSDRSGGHSCSRAASPQGILSRSLFVPLYIDSSPFRFARCQGGTILYSDDLAPGIPRHLSAELIQVNERGTANGPS